MRAQQQAANAGQPNSIKIPPYHYIHVLDRNSNVSRLEVGPQTFIRQDHEQVQTGPSAQRMIVLPKRTYCEVENPVLRDKLGNPTKDKYGQIQVQLGEVEIRFNEDYPQPFPLYPREVLLRAPTQLKIVTEGRALKIQAKRNFKVDGTEYIAGQEYLFKGPGTYRPRVEEEIITVIESQIIGESQALRLRAKQELVDVNGIERKTGDEWLIRTPGAYLPEVHEEVQGKIDPQVIDKHNAIQLRAVQTFVDVYGKERKAGEEYLITLEQASLHIVDIFEDFQGKVPLTILRQNQYCIINNPIDKDTGKNRLGAQILVKGPVNFFLSPGEEIAGGIRDAYLLSEDQALLLQAKEKVNSVEIIVQAGKKQEVVTEYEPGNKWMIYGPCDYIPPLEVEVLERREKIALDKNEGIYVRDTKTGQVRSVFGEAYMLKSHEELWSMELSPEVEKLLAPSYFHTKYRREKHKVVSFRAPFNTAVQVYDYKNKTSRIVFGPDLVTLEPDEVFTQAALSGQTPKKPGVIHTLSIMLGPEFSTDEITVETSDHAVLRLLLAYNWQFRVDKNDQESASKIFNVKDFIGEMCNLMASKVRSAVASADFDTFHKTSARLIRKSIFGLDEKNSIRKVFLMEKNNLIITNVDIKQVEPVDAQTRFNLQKTVSLAIEISTKKQEAAATHIANQNEQAANGELEELKIKDQLKAEEAQQVLLQLQNKSKEVQQQGVAKADAGATAKAEQIIAEVNLEVARTKAQAKKILREAELQLQIQEQQAVLTHEQKLAELEIEHAKEMATIESRKFEEMINSIGQETLIAMANAGPEAQAELLKGLGLQGYIFTDGNNPINLFNGAQGLIGGNLSQP